MRASRENLLRLARFFGLRIGEDWSHRHIAALVYWRASRHTRRRMLASRAFLD